MRNLLIGATSIAAIAAVAAPASAAHLDYFTAKLQELNNSGISGKANFTFNRDTNEITASVNARGLAPNTLHPQHIHGSFQAAGCGTFADGAFSSVCLDGNMAKESNIPSVAQNDVDGDGFLETKEGLPAYGPIILSLADNDVPDPRGALPTNFPMSDADGNLMFTETYDLDDTSLLFDRVTGLVHEPGDLFPLDKRVFVIHGVEVDVDNPEAIGSMFEIDMLTNGPMFFPLLPGAAGELRVADADFNVIPLPAAGWMLLSALGGLGLLGRFSARKREV